MNYIDQLGRSIKINKVPRRLISIVPSQTELLVDLGLESSIVGVTKFCVHPSHLRMSKKMIGGTKQINIEKIIALKPDIILCNKEENTKEIVEALERVVPVHISDVFTLEDSFELIEMYGELFNVKEKASSLVATIKNERKDFQNKIQNKERLKVAYFIWKNPWMVVASNTYIDTMLIEAGFRNAFNNEERYPEIDLVDSRLIDADLIFLSSEPYPFKEKDLLEIKSKFPKKRISVVDGELFSWYGSRSQYAYNYFKTLYPYING